MARHKAVEANNRLKDQLSRTRKYLGRAEPSEVGAMVVVLLLLTAPIWLLIIFFVLLPHVHPELFN